MAWPSTVSRARHAQAGSSSLPEAAPAGDVLCIDDDQVVQILLENVVQVAGARYHGAQSAQEAKALIRQRHFDLILLDRRLPDSDGLLLIETIRRGSDCPIIVLSKMDSPLDRQLGLGLGAEQYVTKPFEPFDLSRRIRTLLERSKQERERRKNEVLKLGRLSFAPGVRRLLIDGRESFLPPAEARVLEALLKQPSEVLDRDDLTLVACGREWRPGGRTPDVLIARLRKRLPKDVAEIVTVHRLGYVLYVHGPQEEQP